MSRFNGGIDERQSRWSKETIEKYVAMTDEARLVSLHPALSKICSEIKGKDVLDFGCGDGAFLRNWIVEKDPSSVTAIDCNSDILAWAKGRELSSRTLNRKYRNIEWVLGDETSIGGETRFDIIFCSLVLMMTGERVKFVNIVNRLIKAMKDSGETIFAVTHPCFRHSGHKTTWNILPDNYSYWKSGVPYKVVLYSPTLKSNIDFTDYHWTLEDYVRAVSCAGGCINAIEELPSEKERKDGEPLYLLFRVMKK